MLLYLDLSGKFFRQKFLRLKRFKQKLWHQVVEAKAEALRVKAKVIEKLPLPHP